MKIVFMGTPQAAVPTLERVLSDGHEIVAVYTQPDKPAGRGKKLAASPVKQVAMQHGLKILQPFKLRSEEAAAEFRAHKADVAVVIAYGRILPEDFLGAFPQGAVNVHFSLLPKYRGAAPVNWAIVHGEKTTGVTTMQMDTGLDTGDILLQRETPIGEQENAVELMHRLSAIGADLLSETLADHGSIVPRPQQDDEATYAPILKKEDGLISWMLSADEIAQRVRGFQPFPTSYTFYNGKKLTIWRCTPEHSAVDIAAIGTIVEAAGDNLRIFCGGASILKIDELQLEGKRRVSSREFINGARPSVGERLGEALR